MTSLGVGNEKVMIVDNKLEGAIFYVVAGHGGPDPGAMGDRSGNDLCEDEYAYDVSLRLYRNLLSHGAKGLYGYSGLNRWVAG
jgi:N-acetylmuramoyl-L-alanine amidase